MGIYGEYMEMYGKYNRGIYIYDTLEYIIYGEYMIIIWGKKTTINLDDLAKLLA
jgi:hypothetical protein